MASSSAGAPPADACRAGAAAAPADCGVALHSALAAAPAPSGTFFSRQRRSTDFSSLPHSLVVCVLAALPADERLRCAEVCKPWLAAVCDRSLWLRVDLSPESGVTHAVTDALLRAIAARAAGHICRRCCCLLRRIFRLTVTAL
jgi:hypothetical protein